MIVFDASALLAYLRDEPGADSVEELLTEADVPMFAHSVNLCEVFHQAWRSDGQAEAENVLRDLTAWGIVERTDLDGPFWRDAGRLIATRRLAGAGLPMGDALGVALALRLDADFVTADRGEIEPLVAAGEVRAIFIR